MAGNFYIFSLYKIHNEDKFFLIRTQKPSFSNTSESDEEAAEKIENEKRTYILDQIKSRYTHHNTAHLDCVGKLQNYPIGDKLYLNNANFELDIFYLETEFGWPWIILGNADSENEFLSELNDDEDLLRLKPLGDVKHIKALFLTENDFNFTELN